MRFARPLDAEVAPDERIGVLLADTVSAPGFRSGRRLQRVSEVDVRRHWRHPLLVLSAASTLPGVAQVAAGANRQHRLRGLLIRRDVGTGLLGPMLDRAGLLAGRHILVHEGPPLPRRVLDAWEKGAENELIAEASVTSGMLFVLSCALERLDVPVRKLAALSRLSAEELRGVTVSPDGSYLHWPSGDVHLDLGSLRYLVDPVWRARADLARIRQHARFGDGVRAVRGGEGSDAARARRHLRPPHEAYRGWRIPEVVDSARAGQRSRYGTRRIPLGGRRGGGPSSARASRAFAASPTIPLTSVLFLGAGGARESHASHSSHVCPAWTLARLKRSPWLSDGLSQSMRVKVFAACSRSPRRQKHRPTP